MSNVLTDEARYKAGKSQMRTFLSNQYLMWRIVSVKSIRKIILTADEFYTDILPEEITSVRTLWVIYSDLVIPLKQCPGKWQM